MNSELSDIMMTTPVSYGRNILMNANYNLKQSILAREDSYNDLGIKFDTKLKSDCHLNDKVNKAYSILGMIKRNFHYLSQDCFVTLYKSLVRSHLEYANCVWSPHHQELILKIESSDESY